MNGTLSPLVLSMGDPAGIGGEIAIKAWLSRRDSGLAPFLVLDDPDRLAAIAGRFGWDAPVWSIGTPEEARAIFAHALPVLPIPLAAQAIPGRPDPRNARAVISSIETAAGLVMAGRARAIVTNPIHKKTLLDSGFDHPGHTEFLGMLAGQRRPPTMMLAIPGLRVVPITVHMPLAEVAHRLTADAIVHAGSVTAAALAADFGIAEPRLAVAALNPHAGEEGALGDEERTVIAPAIAALRETGVDASGPYPADTLFHPAARARFDAVLCMYHDQALIPLKTIDFDHGVNVTLGLPFIRTSPDHGTAFDIAGTGQASAASLIAALRLADELASRRGRAQGAQESTDRAPAR